MPEKPEPTCCTRVPSVVFFMVDYLRMYEGNGWYVTTSDYAPDDIHKRMGRRFRASYQRVEFCPFCAAKLDDFRKKQTVDWPVVTPCEDHLYCQICESRLRECSCEAMETEWEIAPEKTGKLLRLKVPTEFAIELGHKAVQWKRGVREDPFIEDDIKVVKAFSGTLLDFEPSGWEFTFQWGNRYFTNVDDYFIYYDCFSNNVEDQIDWSQPYVRFQEVRKKVTTSVNTHWKRG